MLTKQTFAWIYLSVHEEDFVFYTICCFFVFIRIKDGCAIHCNQIERDLRIEFQEEKGEQCLGGAC